MKMLAPFFLAMGVYFLYLLAMGWSNQEIKARWGWTFRMFHRDREPIWFWLTFVSYVLCVVTSAVVCLMLFLKQG